MKVFISQPMRGKTDEEILAVREQAVALVKEHYPEEEIEVLDSFFRDYQPSTGYVALKFLSKSLELLADADVAVFMQGWEEARGCRIENQCAIDYDITVIEDYRK